MGFGFLFIGYFAAFIGFISFARLFGYGVMLLATKKLKQYNTAFGYLELACGFMLTVSLASSVVDLLNMLMGDGYVADAVVMAIRNAEIFLSCAFSLLMLWCIKRIADETEEKKISFGAVRNCVFILIYAVAYAISLLPLGFTKYFSLPLLLVQLTWIILNLVLIFSCYAKICDESDVEMERKPSRFAFVNEMRAQSDARQKEKEEKWAQRAKQRRK